MIIGISGYARSGKDTIADILIRNHGFTRVAFADKLREVLYALNPIVLGWNEGYGYGTGVWHVQSVIDEYGWDGYKESPFGYEIRRLLQRIGTEAGREVLGDNVWVDALDWHAARNIVIPDARFRNEAVAVKSRGGAMWRVWRPGIGPANGHVSETGLDDWDFDLVLDNDGTIEDLEQQVGQILLGNTMSARWGDERES
jgi:deoxynucleotide monophosphate kinase-like protein